MDEFDDDDGLFSRLAAVAALGEPTIAGAICEDEDPGLELVPEELEFQALVAAVGAAPKRLFRQRSWEHCLHARSCKMIKTLATDVSMCKAEISDATHELAVASFLQGSLATSNGVRVTECLEPEELVSLKIRLACAATAKGSGTGNRRKLQALCAKEVSCVATRVQRAFCLDLFCPAPQPPPTFEAIEAGEAPDSGRMFRIHTWSGEFDETSQRIRALQSLRHKAPTSHGKVGSQIMMQRAKFAVVQTDPHSGAMSVDESVYLFKGLRVEQQTANFLLAAFLKRLPVPLENLDRLRLWATKCELFWFCVTVDRASTNELVVKWVVLRLRGGPSVLLVPRGIVQPTRVRPRQREVHNNASNRCSAHNFIKVASWRASGRGVTGCVDRPCLSERSGRSVCSPCRPRAPHIAAAKGHVRE